MKTTKRKEIYRTNKEKKVGEECICPICKSVFTKKQYAQAFCCNECKVKFHNDRQLGKRNDYFRRYNKKHPERLERIDIYKNEEDKFGHYDDDGDFWTFEEESCEYGSWD